MSYEHVSYERLGTAAVLVLCARVLSALLFLGGIMIMLVGGCASHLGGCM